jgi:acetyl-CoA synthetase
MLEKTLAGKLHWFKRWDKVFEWNNPNFTWFKGGVTNLSYHCTQHHVKNGRGKMSGALLEH